MPRIVDKSFVLEIFSNNEQQLKDYLSHYNNEVNEHVLGMGVNRRVTDEENGEIIQRALGKMNLSELRQVEKDKRDAIVSRLKEIDGLSIRQIARITGLQ